MAQFTYKARSRSGQVKQGMLESADRAGALSMLQRDGLFPVSVQAAKVKGKPEKGARAARTAAPKPLEEGGRTVSYTHLTLPTICSV